eukprot:TRINITY_DN8449_c0_g1_i2.p1 TRINITY_DN8449_c0_g1~~TRINITY_DN8449_c0_g1_i2.p1  ORF type:complete len:208 (+),score=42.75 TRINITY_DN8449_c0_g1_i2:260-883(+)
MSTRGLRAAAKAGVDVKDAVHVESSIAVSVAFMYPLNAWLLIWKDQNDFLNMHVGTMRVLVLSLLLIPILVILLLLRLDLDDRSFALKVVNKLAFVALLSMFPGSVRLYFQNLQVPDSFLRDYCIIWVALGLLALLLGAARLPRVARLPCCGRVVAQALVMRGCGRFVQKMTWACEATLMCRRQGRDCESDTASSTAESGSSSSGEL